MFGFSRGGNWGDLPSPFVVALKSRLGQEFAQLDHLVRRFSIFRQRLFRSRAFREAPVEEQIASLAILLGSLGNQEAQLKRLDVAEWALYLSLRLKEDGNPAHLGLANLLYIRGDLVGARRHAIRGLDAIRLLSTEDAPAELTGSPSGDGAALGMAQIIAEAELASKLAEGYGDVLELAMSDRVIEFENSALKRRLEAIAEDPNEAAIQGYLDFMAERFHVVGWGLRHAMSNRAASTQTANPFGKRYASTFADLQYFDPMMRSFTAAMIVSPRFLDVYVTVAHVYQERYLHGMGYQTQARQYASIALELLNAYQSGDNTVVISNSKLVAPNNQPSLRETITHILN